MKKEFEALYDDLGEAKAEGKTTGFSEKLLASICWAHDPCRDPCVHLGLLVLTQAYPRLLRDVQESSEDEPWLQGVVLTLSSWLNPHSSAPKQASMIARMLKATTLEAAHR